MIRPSGMTCGATSFEVTGSWSVVGSIAACRLSPAMSYTQMRQDGASFCFMFIFSGPRMANTMVLPSGDASTSLTSYESVPVMRAVMLVSVALGEAVSRLNRLAAGNALRIMRRSSAFFGMVRFT